MQSRYSPFQLSYLMSANPVIFVWLFFLFFFFFSSFFGGEGGGGVMRWGGALLGCFGFFVLLFVVIFQRYGNGAVLSAECSIMTVQLRFNRCCDCFVVTPFPIYSCLMFGNRPRPCSGMSCERTWWSTEPAGFR